MHDETESELDPLTEERAFTRFARGLSVALFFLLVALLIIALTDEGIRSRALEVAMLGWAELQRAPAPLYFAIVSVLMILPIPASAFFIAAGPLYGIAVSLLYLPLAVAVNTLLVHAISGSVLRPRLERFVERRGYSIPSPSTKSEEIYLLLLIRVTPGIPYFFQSWTLGLAGVDRWRFVVISVGAQMIYGSGFVILGRSAFEGDLGMGVFAVALVIVAGIAMRLLRRRMKARAPAMAVDETSS